MEAANADNTANKGGLSPDEKIASLFQPDTLIAAQYFENLRRKTLPEPEKSLMLAVLQDAVEIFQDNISAQTGKRKALFRQAEEWIFEEDPGELFSFATICEVLEIHPDYLRRGLLRWKEKKLGGRKHPDGWKSKQAAG